MIASELLKNQPQPFKRTFLDKCDDDRAGSRWWRSQTCSSPSPTNTSKKPIYMWNDSHRTSTEHWQKTLNLQKGQETLHITGYNKGKKEREIEKRNEDGTSIPERESLMRKGTHSLGSHLTDRDISRDRGTSKLQ